MSDSISISGLEKMILNLDAFNHSGLRELEIEYARAHQQIDAFALPVIAKLTKDLALIMRKFPALVEEDYLDIAYNASLYNQEGIRRTETELEAAQISRSQAHHLTIMKAHFHTRAGGLAMEIYYKTYKQEWLWWWYSEKVKAREGFSGFERQNWAIAAGSAGDAAYERVFQWMRK